MNVATVMKNYHPLCAHLACHLDVRSPIIQDKVVSTRELWKGKEQFDSIILLPFGYNEAGLLADPAGIISAAEFVIWAAGIASASVILVSGPEAAHGYQPGAMPVGDQIYGSLLAEVETLVRQYQKGIVIRIPLLESDPRIRDQFKSIREDRDVIFSLGLADEVAKVIGDAIESGWYGLHQLGGGNHNLRLSTLLEIPAPGATYDYTLQESGVSTKLKTNAIDVWDGIKAGHF